MYRYVGILLVGIIVGFLTGWKTQGWRLGQEIATIRANTAKQAEMQEQAARDREAQFTDKLAKVQERRNAEVADINRKHTAVVTSLRQRPERISVTYQVPGASTACVGTTGAELARGDAEFLAGYAADAAKLEAALSQCEAAYNELRN